MSPTCHWLALRFLSHKTHFLDNCVCVRVFLSVCERGGRGGGDRKRNGSTLRMHANVKGSVLVTIISFFPHLLRLVTHPSKVSLRVYLHVLSSFSRKSLFYCTENNKGIYLWLHLLTNHSFLRFVNLHRNWISAFGPLYPQLENIE